MKNEYSFTKHAESVWTLERENIASAKGWRQENAWSALGAETWEGMWLSLGEQQERGQIWEAKDVMPGSLDIAQ